MKPYNDEELNAKIHAFLATKIPELNGNAPAKTKAEKMEIYIFPKLMESLTFIMPLVAR